VLNRWQYWLLTALAAFTMLIALLNAKLFVDNRSLQAEVADRQQFIQQSAQLQGLYSDIARALADLSARNNDQQLRRVLEARGITFAVTPSAGSAATQSQNKSVH